LQHFAFSPVVGRPFADTILHDPGRHMIETFVRKEPINANRKSVLDRKEGNHVYFAYHQLFTASGCYRYRHTKQYAFEFQVFHLGSPDVYHGLGCLFLYHWWGHRGNSDLAEAGEEITS
jgi:hypothetical protein